ncbi:MAG: DUF5659 domain-containing protein [Clostridia bacterium]
MNKEIKKYMRKKNEEALKDTGKVSHQRRDNTFHCYSVKLHAFLQSNGLEPVSEKRHQKTHKIAFIYEKTKKLDQLLTQWTNNKDRAEKPDASG